MAIRLLVCGGRTYSNRSLLDRVLTLLKPGVIITGGARGADLMALDWASDRHLITETYLADWNTHGNSAGPIRNKQMLDEGKPDLILAFPGGKGTADMIRQVSAARLPVLTVVEPQ